MFLWEYGRPLDRYTDESFARPGFESYIQERVLSFFSVFVVKYRYSN
jgi:hypothetical protein